MTDTTPATLDAVRDANGVPIDRVACPATGVITMLDAPAPDLLDALNDLDTLEDALKRYRTILEFELIRRVDATTKRTAEVDGCVLEVNAPTEDVYHVDAVRRELEPLVEAGHVDRTVLDAIIVTPAPAPPPAPKVDKRAINRLKSSDNRELVAALARARVRSDNRRSVKVKGRPIAGTAEEVPASATGGEQ